MPESANQTSGPSLEQILWRAMDRWQERPALVDAEEFAAHIEGVFAGDLPEETWVARFFEGEQGLHRQKQPADMAEAIVHAARGRLHAYEFDLRRLEYVIIEDKEKVVVVSDFGQFALASDDTVRRAVESAVVPQGGLQRGGGEPKGYFVRASGEVVAVDVKKVARSLEQLLVRQVSMPAVEKPGARLLPFGPARRALSESREALALRQDARARQALPGAPRTRAPDAGAAGARTALFVLMPDGSLARPEMGSATRWQEMLGKYARASVTVQAGNVVAVISGGASGTVGERALARSEGLSAVRADAAPIRLLGDDDLARAFARGARVVPGLARGDRFWIQPEAAFKPDRALAQGGGGPSNGALVQRSLQLGEITGDPWADWALTGGGELSREAMMALRGRTRHALRAALDGEMSVPPALADKLRGARGRELMLAGAPVVGFRAPDGSVVVQRAQGAIRLAALGRGGLEPIDLPLPGAGAPLAARSGALPATALAALQMALEQTANAGGYRLPMLHIDSARDALEVGAALDLASFDPRRSSVRLAGPASFDGQMAQLVLSMPFPNQGELHVGSDLSEALQAYLGAQVRPALAGAGGLVVRMRGRSEPGDGLPFDWAGLHAQAAQRAQDAVITLDLPMVQPLVAGSASVSGLPLLLQRALAQGGDWTPGPGAPMPGSIRELALKGPFDTTGLPQLVDMLPPPRPLNPGEEEIVIPMPLWAQMGRGQLSETDQIMASPLAPAGYAPPLGVYRLVVPGGGAVDMTGGAPQGTPGIVDLVGPRGLELAMHRQSGAVLASSLGGRQLIGRVALDDGETVVTRRGRIRVGAPLGSGGGAAPALVSGAVPSMPSIDLPSGTFVDGTYTPPGSGSSTRTALPARPSPPGAGALSGGGDRTLVVAAAEGGAIGAQLGSALADAGSAASSASRAGSSTPPFITGLQPGMWSGHRRSSTSGYQPWTYRGNLEDRQQSWGGVDLSSLSRPTYPSLPTSLRFRYVGAPLWWSGSTRSIGADAEADESPAGRAMRSGLRAANSAASIWRSILVAGPRWGGAGDFSGGMDAGHDASADEMSSLSRRFDALTAASLVGAGAVPAAAAGGASYLAVTGSGSAGPVSRAAAARARADSIEMSIVAAIPPAPPPLESMGSGAIGGDAPHARSKGHAHGGHQQHKESAEAVSHSKIEGSVDAIAQRIYHRIRRRIQSDRERFGG